MQGLNVRETAGIRNAMPFPCLSGLKARKACVMSEMEGTDCRLVKIR